MHAVVVKVTVNDAEPAVKHLHEEVVPRVSQAPGFVAGYWMRVGEDKGLSVLVFESEDAARAVAGGIEGPPGGEVTIESAEAHEVIANA